MKSLFLIILILALPFLVSLQGPTLANQPDAKDEIVQPAENIAEKTNTEVEDVSETLDLGAIEYQVFQLQDARNCEYETFIPIESYSELTEFINDHPFRFDETQSVAFDQGFFEHSKVYACLVSQFSGSIEFSVKGFEYDSGVLTVHMERFLEHELHTDDIDINLVLLGINKNDAKKINRIEPVITMVYGFEANQTETEVPDVSDTPDLGAIEYQVFQLNYKENCEFETFKLIESYSELTEFINDYPFRYDETQSVAFDQGFFEHSNVYACLVYQFSGLIEFSVKGFEYDSGVLSVHMERFLEHELHNDACYISLVLLGINKDDAKKIDRFEPVISMVYGFKAES